MEERKERKFLTYEVVGFKSDLFPFNRDQSNITVFHG